MKMVSLTYQVKDCTYCPLVNKIWLSKAGNKYKYTCSLTNSDIEKVSTINEDCPLEEDEIYEYPNLLVVQK